MKINKFLLLLIIFIIPICQNLFSQDCILLILKNKKLENLYKKEFSKYNINIKFTSDIKYNNYETQWEKRLENTECTFAIFQPISIERENCNVTITFEVYDIKNKQFYTYSNNFFTNENYYAIPSEKNKRFVYFSSKYIYYFLTKFKKKGGAIR